MTQTNIYKFDIVETSRATITVRAESLTQAREKLDKWQDDWLHQEILENQLMDGFQDREVYLSDVILNDTQSYCDIK